MEHTEHAEQDLVIVGIAQRIDPAEAATSIPALWGRFMSEAVASKVTSGALNDGNIYAVYCDYEADHQRPYTMVLGVAVSKTADVPEGMRRVRVPSGKYAAFTAKGDPSAVIWQTWTHINTEWPARNARRYIADYERYPTRAMTPSSVEADVIVGID